MKKWIALLMFYVAGAILTNSYVRMYRWNEWNNNSRAHLWSYMKSVSVYDLEEEYRYNGRKVFFATIFWPVYLLCVGADTMVCTKVEIE